MSTRSKLVQSAEEVSRISEALSKEKMIGLDTEFIRETTFFPKVALIQVSTSDEVWLIDPLVCTEQALQPLFEVLLNPAIVKIIHAAYADQECLFWNYKVVASPVLDTAVAAALLGRGDNVGLGKLARDFLGVNLPKGRARAKWGMRPLPEELLHYAAQDVHHLVNLGKLLWDELGKLNRQVWALKESELHTEDFDAPPEQTAVKLARTTEWDDISFAVLVELVRWREDRSRKSNIPRGWVADNEVLTSLAKSKPKNFDQLRVFRGLSAKEVDRNGDAILKAIEKGMKDSQAIVANVVREAPPQIADTHVSDLLKSFVSFLATKYQVANRLLVNPSNLPKILQCVDVTEAEWVSKGLMSHYAGALIGHEMKEFLEGKKAMTIKNGRVIILSA